MKIDLKTAVMKFCHLLGIHYIKRSKVAVIHRCVICGKIVRDGRKI
jgi:hypothetical protein